MRIFLVRHAPVDAAGICYGQRDVPCQLDAHTAAARIAERLPERPDEVWASPWLRARLPAEELARRFGKRLRLDARLAELSMGVFEGHKFAALAAEPAFVAWMEAWRTAAPPGGETLQELSARVRAWREEQRERQGTLLAVTHAGVIRVLRALERRLPIDGAFGEPVPHLLPEVLQPSTPP